jgi:hypothetical protein
VYYAVEIKQKKIIVYTVSFIKYNNKTTTHYYFKGKAAKVVRATIKDSVNKKEQNCPG